MHLDNIKKARAFGPLVLAGNYEKHRVWLKGLADDIGKASEIDIFLIKFFVLSPKGDVVELARGASPLDFAYLIHSDVGNHCNGARLMERAFLLITNSKMVRLLKLLLERMRKTREILAVDRKKLQMLGQKLKTGFINRNLKAM